MKLLSSTKNKIIFFFVIIGLIILVIKIFQYSTCPKYKNCEPPLLFETEKQCHEIEWYCKGRTSIVE